MPVVDLVLVGLAVTLEPVPNTGFIVLLTGSRGPRKGTAFILGWFLSLAVVVVATVAVTGGAPPQSSTAPATALLGLKLAIGVVLIVVAMWYPHRRRGRAAAPSWMDRVDRLSLWVAAGLGALLQPWVLVAAGAATVAQLHVSSIWSGLLLVGFCLLCTATLLAMAVYTAAAPVAAAARLAALRGWLDAHRERVVVVVALVVGGWLVADNLFLLVS